MSGKAKSKYAKTKQLYPLACKARKRLPTRPKLVSLDFGCSKTKQVFVEAVNWARRQKEQYSKKSWLYPCCGAFYAGAKQAYLSGHTQPPILLSSYSAGDVQEAAEALFEVYTLIAVSSGMPRVSLIPTPFVSKHHFNLADSTSYRPIACWTRSCEGNEANTDSAADNDCFKCLISEADCEQRAADIIKMNRDIGIFNTTFKTKTVNDLQMPAEGDSANEVALQKSAIAPKWQPFILECTTPVVDGLK